MQVVLINPSSLSANEFCLGTFADMNTKTDVDVFSAIQLQYCIDRDLSPAGMTMPSTVEAQTTSAGGSSPSETGGILNTAGSSTEAGSTSRSRPNSGPSNTGGKLRLELH